MKERNGRNEVRIAAAGDIHCTRKSQGRLREIFRKASEQADIIVLCGDLTDYGLEEEAHTLAEEIAAGITVPVVAVLGNHDFESDHADQVMTILCQAGVTVLDGDSCEIMGIGFAGVKGFAGGFGKRSLEPWGEPIIKKFVHEVMEEALKLEAALARLNAERRVAVLHYSPIPETVHGEPEEILPFLGSRRLEEPLNRFPVDVIFHGHAHHGSPHGKTSSGIPVYNVAMPLLRTLRPGELPFHFTTLEVAEEQLAEHRISEPRLDDVAPALP